MLVASCVGADEQAIDHHIVKDHRNVEALFEELASADGDADRMRALHAALKREILSHTTVEDRVVYIPIEAHEQFAGAIEYARDEHQDANALLLELDEMELGLQAFMSKADELRRTLKAHMNG